MTRGSRIIAIAAFLALVACSATPEPQPEGQTIRHRPWQPKGLMLVCEASRG